MDSKIKWKKGFPQENTWCLVVTTDPGVWCVTPYVVNPQKDHYGDWDSKPKIGWVCLNQGAENQPAVKAWIPIDELKQLEGYPFK